MLSCAGCFLVHRLRCKERGRTHAHTHDDVHGHVYAKFICKIQRLTKTPSVICVRPFSWTTFLVP